VRDLGPENDLKAQVKVDLKVMPNGQIEILGARERRRRWSTEQKLRIVAETEEPGATIVGVAARHDVYPSLLHAWRRLAQRGELVADPMTRLLPVRIADAMPPATDPPA
jgi:transposase-like protein